VKGCRDLLRPSANHHAILCRQIIDHIDFLDRSIAAALTQEVTTSMTPTPTTTTGSPRRCRGIGRFRSFEGALSPDQDDSPLVRRLAERYGPKSLFPARRLGLRQFETSCHGLREFEIVAGSVTIEQVDSSEGHSDPQGG
jgi:hypothetical protein